MYRCGRCVFVLKVRRGQRSMVAVPAPGEGPCESAYFCVVMTRTSTMVLQVCSYMYMCSEYGEGEGRPVERVMMRCVDVPVLKNSTVSACVCVCA